MPRTVLFTIAAIMLAAAATSATDQWPQFRGLQGGVADDDPALPETWGETENIVWKTPIPGLGWSSPIVWGEHVFVTTAVSEGTEVPPQKGLFDPVGDHSRNKSTAVHRWMLIDLDYSSGAIRWQRELHVAAPPTSKQMKNSYASETPVTDGERVYVYFGSIGLVAAVDFGGQTLWTRHVGAFEGRQAWGTSQSPLLYRDRLYIVNDNREKSFIAALDATTGASLWQIDRQEMENWSTPIVWDNALRTEIVTAGENRVRSYGLDGKLLWELGGMSFSTIPTPVVGNGLLFVSSGYPGSALRPVYAIRPGAAGDISLKDNESSNAFIVWANRLLGSYNTSALVYRGQFYTLLDRGLLLAHDAGTGQQVYGRQRIALDSSGFTASPWAYNGKIFATSEDGDTFVIAAGPMFSVIGKNSLDGMVLASPAIARGSVFIRTSSRLYRVARRP